MKDLVFETHKLHEQISSPNFVINDEEEVKRVLIEMTELMKELAVQTKEAKEQANSAKYMARVIGGHAPSVS